MKQKCLMLGCGRAFVSRTIRTELSVSEEDTHWVTLDHDPDTHPDYLFDLNQLEKGADLPEGDFDEIHAYDVLEHFGHQGDFRGYYNTFNALWRALKPGGFLLGYVPREQWAWGDPGHCRSITQQSLLYLTEGHMDHPATTNYLSCIKGHFWRLVGTKEINKHLIFSMRRPTDDTTV